MPAYVKKSPLGSIAVKLIVVAGMAAVFFAGMEIYKEVTKKNRIQAEIDKLQQEAEKISKENTTLGDKIAYLGSREYQEKEAKDKLSLQSPDENLVIVKPGVSREVQTAPEKPSSAAFSISNSNPLPNPVKWWNYFFKY